MDDDTQRLMKKIGKIIYVYRRKAYMSRTQLGKLIGVKYTTLQTWEYGKGRIPLISILGILSALAIPIDVFTDYIYNDVNLDNNIEDTVDMRPLPEILKKNIKKINLQDLTEIYTIVEKELDRYKIKKT